jgi:hypothetical protein
MRRRDHDAEVGVDVSGEECRRRRRNNAGVEDIDTGGGQPCGNCRANELARDTRVSRENRNGPLAALARLPPEHDGGRLGQADCEFYCQAFVGKPANAIGPKKSTHDGPSR